MLSAKARAFSVESLLAKKDLSDEKAERNDRSHSCYPLLQVGPSSLPAFQHTTNGSGIKQEIKVELCQNELWESFHRLGTEMIVSKTGRRMFPALRIRVSGLDPNALYKVSVTFRPVDKYKYRYIYYSSQWMVAGRGDPILPNQSYAYREWPLTGATLMNQVTSLEKVKLTNSESPKCDQISLVSMQKFRPCIHITHLGDNLRTYKDMTVEFSQTTFITVTAYQNQEITRLKIARNPFAKGFREANKHRTSLEAMLATLGMFQPRVAIAKPRKRVAHKSACSLKQAKSNRFIPAGCTVAQKVSIPRSMASNKTQIAMSFNSYTGNADIKGLNCIPHPATFVIHSFSQPITSPSCVIASPLTQERLQPLQYHLVPSSGLDLSQTNLTHSINGGISTPSANQSAPHLALAFGQMVYPQPTHLTNSIL